MSLVVSDTSPIRALHHLNLLNQLGQLFGRVLVPPAVAKELGYPEGRFAPVELDRVPNIEVVTPRNLELVQQMELELDRAESEAIALAVEQNATVLIDELLGRAVAARVGLERIGVLGVLVAAKRRRQIPAIAPLIERLQTELRFFISAKLKEEILRDAGEEL